jgi:hypothetical protein
VCSAGELQVQAASRNTLFLRCIVRTHGGCCGESPVCQLCRVSVSCFAHANCVGFQCDSEEQCVNWLHGLMVAWSMARKASGLGSALPPTVALKLTTIAATKEDVVAAPKPPSTTPPSSSMPLQAPKVTVAVEGGDVTHRAPGEEAIPPLPSHLPRSRRSSESAWSYSDRLSYWSKTLFDHVRANRKGDVMLAFEEVAFVRRALLLLLPVVLMFRLP